MKRLSAFNVISLTLGFAFLYIPMLILILFSFNESKLVTVWAGFSTKWYAELMQNEAMLRAAWVTVKVAVFSSTIATVLGTMAAYVMVRGGRFMGRTLFSGMIYAPLVMPEVITGLSLLLLFIGIGLDRGVLTIVLAHTTFSMCYVSVVVSSRLATFDRSLEEAALDLGCSQAQAFRLVTLPIIAPAVVSGWLLAFTLSLDDLVIASFTTGPAATTLPIKIFSAVRLGVSPEINALSTIMIGIVTVGVISASLVSKRALVKQRREEQEAGAHRMMRRIFSDYAYGAGPRSNCWWDETCHAPNWPELQGDQTVDVAIVGGGFTGLSAALHMSEAGLDVAVLEAETPGWGASGRNGGFCCLGGAKLGARAMARFYGSDETQVYQAGEEAAVHLVERLIARHRINADTHSQGETVMAHSAKARAALMREAETQGAEFIDAPQLTSLGLGGAFHGALTTPVGFALNPRKYLFGLAHAAQTAGADLYQNSPAISLHHDGKHWHAVTPTGRLRASRMVIATNGYSSENLPDWLAGRYIPAQSTVMVTRPITPDEQARQGWTSAQMAYDTRHMLHYFRLMPDRRFLFGMRGGLTSSPRAEKKIRTLLRSHFERLFPAWRHVDTTHSWSGMVCLSRNLVPFVGAVPDHPGLFAGLCYHGNGVAMGSYCGALLAQLVQGHSPDLPYSQIMQRLPRFPFGRARRLLMPPAYGLLGLMD